MSYTRAQWATDLLHAIGNANPTPNVVQWVVSWTQAETAPPSNSYQGATFNLLNTTQPATGATTFNSIGVKNYTSYAQGIQANADTLRNGYYPDLLRALQTNDERALGYGVSSPSAGVLGNLHTWCGSCGYGNQFISIGGSGAMQQFNGDATGIVTHPSPSMSTTSLSSSQPCNPIIQGLFPYMPCGATTAADNKIGQGVANPQQAVTDMVGTSLSSMFQSLSGDFAKVGLFIVATVLIIVGFLVIGGGVK